MEVQLMTTAASATTVVGVIMYVKAMILTWIVIATVMVSKRLRSYEYDNEYQYRT